MTQQPASKKPRISRDVMVASICGFVVAFMVGASYAAVPFYDWFCRATGFNGTTQVATSAPEKSLERRINVRFDSNVSGGLPWKFEAEQTEISVKIGEVVTVYYTVTNQALDVPTVLPPGGTAHLLLNGDFGDLTIALAATGNIQASGQRHTTPCPADFNGDGHLNILDFLGFLNAYAAGDPRGDFNGDGQRNILDFITFLNAFAIGC